MPAISPEPPSTDARMLRIWRDMLFSHSAIVQKLSDDLNEQVGLTLAQYDVLLKLLECPDGAMRMGELAGQVLVTTSGLTRVVDKLETAGLVTRVRVSSDRRGVLVSLTDAGRATLSGASKIHLDGIRRNFSRYITEDELPVLERFFRRLFSEVRGAPAVEGLPTPTLPPRDAGTD